MIPFFPQFKKLELSDKADIETITSKHPPYSDFHFSSMWAWDIVGGMCISILNENLVVQFNDYISGKTFMSFIGSNMINETTKELIDFSEINHNDGTLKLIPEAVVELLDKTKFEIIEDRDSQDYVYSIENLKNMDKWKGHNCSKSIRQFLKKYPDYVVKVCSTKEILKKEYINLFEKWVLSKNSESLLDSREYSAFKKFMELEDENIKIVSIYNNDILIGFNIYEIFSDTYAISNFSKIDRAYNVYNVLNWEEAKILSEQKIKYYNWEQDLGIPGLRKSKENYKPELFLKKFFVKKRE